MLLNISHLKKLIDNEKSIGPAANRSKPKSHGEMNKYPESASRAVIDNPFLFFLRTAVGNVIDTSPRKSGKNGFFPLIIIPWTNSIRVGANAPPGSYPSA
jgi:hypothetical protein